MIDMIFGLHPVSASNGDIVSEPGGGKRCEASEEPLGGIVSRVDALGGLVRALRRGRAPRHRTVRAQKIPGGEVRWR